MTDPVFNAASSNFGLTDVGEWASPTFADIDGDGDLDAFIGNRLGNTLFFLNTPASSAPNTPVFSQQGGDAPFGLINVRRFASPTLVDMDGDSDLDAFIGNKYGETWFFKNTGSASSAAFSVPVTDNPFNPFGINKDGNAINPSFVDIDGDGDLDAFLGKDSKINNVVIGETWFYENTGSASSAVFSTPVTNNPFGLTDVGKYANPTLVDIDGDGDLDAFIGNEVGEIRFFRNTGSASSATFSAQVTSNPFGLTDRGDQASPTFVDIDGDGDLDAFIGYQAGDTLFFLNIAPGIKLTQTAGTAAVTEGGASDTYTVVLNTAPTADVTITLNNTNGQVTHSVATLIFTSANWSTAQTVTVSAVNDTVKEGKHTGVIQHSVSSADGGYNGLVVTPVLVAVTDNDLPASDPTFQAAQTIPFGLSNVDHEASPTFVDIDGDGDLDAFIGNNAGNTLFFRNTAGASTPVFVPQGDTALFGLMDVGSTASPTFVDIDGDGDLDAFIGNFDGSGNEFVGNTLFFRNTGDASAPVFSQQGGTAPFGLGNVGTYASPTLVDIDGDGDLDAFIGSSTGDTVFFRNTASVGASTPAFSLEATNPFGLVNVGGYASPTLVDIDSDGDLDAFIGNQIGDTVFFRNTASAGTSTPVFSLEVTNPLGLINVGNTANPSFADIDGDGDLDAFIGNSDGDVLFFLNAPTPVTISDLNEDLTPWAGVGNTVLLDSASNVTVTGSGWTSLTVGRTTPVSSDVFSFYDSSDFTFSDSDLKTVDDTTFATFTNTAGVLAISFNGNATAALVQAVMRGIQYRNDTPTGNTTIRFSLSDASTTATADVTVSSDTIYVTNTTDTATIGVSDGVSFSEAVAIAAADSTGSQTLVLGSNLAGLSISASGNPTLLENLRVDGDDASGAHFGSGTITVGAGVSLTFSNGSGDTLGMYSNEAVLAGAGGIIKEGAGQLKLYGTNTHSGGTSVLGGTLQMPDQRGLGAGTVTLDGGGLTFMSNPTITNTMVIGAGGGSLDGGAPVTISGNIAGPGALMLTGGTKTLSGTNTHAATVVTSGGLNLSGGAAIADTGSVTIASGATLLLTNSETIGSLAGEGAVALGANTLTTGGDNTSTTVSGAIAGTGALEKIGTGTLTLSGANTYTGATTVSAGGLTLSGGSSIADTSAVTLASGTTLTLAGGGETIGSLAGAGNVVLTYSLTAGSDNTSTNFSGAISSTSTNGLIKTGTGTLTLSGANTFTGAVTVSNGTLALTSSTSIPNSAAVTVSANGILTLGSTKSIGSLAGAGAVVLGSYTLNVGNSSATDFSGVISGTGHLLKQGSGTLTLSGNNTYSGFTMLASGTLSVASDSNLGGGELSLSEGVTLQVTGVTTIDNAIYVSGPPGTVMVRADAAVTLSGVISGSGVDLTKTGTGALTLSTNSDYTGATTVTAGALLVDGTLASSSAVTVATGATLGGGGSIGLAGTSGAVTVEIGGTIAAGNSPGILTLNNGLTVAAGGIISAEVFGTAVGTGYDQIMVYGAVNITGATLSINLGGFTPNGGDSFVLISNDGTDAITGTVMVGSTALAEGATFTQGGKTYQVSYRGGDGNDNDLVLTNIIPNTAPVITNLNGDIVAWAGVVALDTADKLLISDAENDAANWNGASLTVQRFVGLTATPLATDHFYFSASGFAVSAGNLQTVGDGPTTFGAYTYTDGVISFSFNAAATTTLVRDVMRSLQYQNLTPTGDTTIRFSLSDGTATTTADVQVNSNSIYATNTDDTSTANLADGMSFSEAMTIANSQNGADTLVLTSALASQTVTLASALAVSESVTVNADAASGVNISSATITVATDNTLTVFNAASDTATISSIVAGEGTLAKTGAGTLVLSGSNTYAGGTHVFGGTLSVSSGANLGNAAVSLLFGATLDFAHSFTLDNDMVLGKDGGTVNTDYSNTISGTISAINNSSNSLTKTGTGTLTLSGANTNTGGITVMAGKLQVSNDDALSSGTVTLNGGTLVLAAATNTIDNAILLETGNGTISVVSGAATMSGNITGTGALAKTGGQLLTLSGTNTYEGGTTIAGANGVSITNGANLGTGAVTINSGSNLGVTGAATISHAITLVESATINNANAVELSGVISGGALTKTGAGTLTLTGVNTYTGATTVSAGGLALINGSSIADTCAVTVASGATLTLAGGAETIGSLAGAGNMALTNYRLTAGGDNTSTTFSGVISGAGSGLTKAGSGTLTLTGTNSYTGSTTVSAGTLAVNGALSGTSAVTVFNGATLSGSGSIGLAGTSGAATVQSGGTLAAGNGVGTLTLNNGLTVAAGGIISADVFGTTVGTGYDQIKVYGTVTLTGATLSINLDGFTPTIGSSFTLIDNDGSADAITGTVKVGGVSLVDNARFMLGSQDFTISYTGGDGNDLVLRAVLPNTAPTFAGVPGTAQAVTAGSPAALADFTVADAEQGTTSLSVTLTASNGTINGLTDADSNVAGIQLTGTAASINSAIAAATFIATAAGAASIGISVSDGVAEAVTGTYNLVAAPTTTIASIAISADTGTSDTDFITKTAAQNVSGTLNANLASGERVEVSLDNGNNWATASSSTGANSWSLTGQTLLSSNTLKVRVADVADNTGTVASQAYVLDTTAPVLTIFSIALSEDTGTSSTDFTTKTAAQTISGTTSANLVSGEVVEVSLDNGGNWATASSSIGANSWSLTGVTLTGSDTLKVRVTDNAGNSGTEASQAYVLDTNAPTNAISAIALSADTGTSASDFVTKTVAQTITATLSAALTTGDILYGSLDNGVSWANITSKIAGGTSISWDGVALSGNNTLQFKVIDAAGNDGAVASQAYVIDTTAPTVTIASIALSLDTGMSASDFVTKTAAQTISGTTSANLLEGEVVQVSRDNGSNWATATSNVGQKTWSLAGQTLTASNTLKVRVADTAGNTGSVASQVYVLDTTAPTTPTAPDLMTSSDSGFSNTDNLTNKTTPNFTGTAEQGSTVTLYDTDGATVLGTATADGAGSWTITSTTLSEGAHTMSANAIDAAGNVSTASSGLTVTIDTTAPAVPSALTSDEGAYVNAAQAADGTSVRGTTDAGSTVSVTFTGTVHDGDQNPVTVTVDAVVSGSGFVAALSKTQLQALGEGVISYVATAMDVAGNVKAAATSSFILDTVAPASASGILSIVENAANATVVGALASAGASVFTLTNNAGGRFAIDVSTGVVAVADGSLLNFEGDSSYGITVKTVDAAGNFVEASLSVSVIDSNEAPTAVVLTTALVNSQLAENTSTVSRLKVADIAISDEALGSNSVTLTGLDAASFEVVGNALYLKANTALNFEAKPGYAVTVNVADSSVSGSTPVTASYALAVTDVNEAPTAVVLTTALVNSQLAENTSTVSRLKVADIAISDEALGGNSVTLTGLDAASFDVVGNALYLKANTALNFETKASYAVTVNVADGSVSGSTPVTADYTLSLIDVNEAPTAVVLTTALVNSQLAENTDTTTRVKVADIAISDDALGSNSVTLSGTDKDFFEVEANALYLKADTALNFETKASYAVTVNVKDNTLGSSTPVTANYALAVTDVNEAPTAVVLATALVNSQLAENTDTTTRLKVADIAISDDALGGNSVTLTGADAASFEVVGNALYLKANTALNFEAKPSYAVTVNVADGSVSGSSAVTANYALAVTDVNEAPSAVVLTTALVNSQLAENTDTMTRLKVADIAITDDAPGSNAVSLTGTDANSFEVETGVLYIKAGIAQDFEAKSRYAVTVNVADSSVTGSTPVTADYTLTVTNVNEAPSVTGVPSAVQGVTAGTAAALADFAVADPDGANVNLSVTLTATNGTLNNLTDADSNLANGIQLTGTAASINTALASATFTATAAGAASIGISASDGIATPVTATYSLVASAAPAPDPTPPLITVTNANGATTVITSTPGSTTAIPNPAAGSTVTTSGSGSTSVVNPGRTVTLNNTGTGTVTTSGIQGSTTLTITGTGTQRVDISAMLPGQVLTIDNSGTGTVDLSHLPDGVIVRLLGTGPVLMNDSDGATASVENLAPALTGGTLGDGNGDGTPDALQSNVASVSFIDSATAQTNPGNAAPVFVSLIADAKDGKIDTSDGNSATLNDVKQLDAPANLPAEVKMPMGLIAFNSTVGLSGVASTGVTETFSLYVDASLGVNGYWKQNADKVWVNLASEVYGGKLVTEGGKTRLDFVITDGGVFDADGQVNGLIVDPGAAGHVPLSLVGYAPDLPPGGFWF